MQMINKLINSNDILFDIWSDSPLCDILNSANDNGEVIIALTKSKYDKAAGMNEIPVEFHKYSSGVLENLVVVLSI